MKSNIGKYIFVIFIVGIIIFAVFKIKEGKQDGQIDVESPNSSSKEQQKVKEIRVGIARFRYN